MSEVDVREHLQRAVDTVAVKDMDVDVAEALFDEYKGRLDSLRRGRGGGR